MVLNKGLLGGGFVEVYQPSLTNPTTDEVEASRTPTLTSSAFAKFGNVTHLSTDWVISEASDFNTTLWSSLNDTTNKVSITTGDLGGGQRYVRVRYKASDGTYSPWSATIPFTSPWVSPDNADTGFASGTVFEMRQNTGVWAGPPTSPVSIDIRAGTYRFTLYGGGGGGAAGGGNGPRGGGGAGAVVRDVLYSSPDTVTVTIGTKGAFTAQNADNSIGGWQGGGSGGGGGMDQWVGGAGGGYSTIQYGDGESAVAAGGGGAGADGGGVGGPGGNSPGAGGSAGGLGQAGNAGTGGGGGGGGSNEGNQPSGGPAQGGSNSFPGPSGAISKSAPGGGSSPTSPGYAAERYESQVYSYYFGDGDQMGGLKVEKLAAQSVPVVDITTDIPSTLSRTAGDTHNFTIVATDTANNDSTIGYQWKYSTDAGVSWTNIGASEGGTSATLTRYSPFYYSDNSHKIKCAVSITNTAGTDTEDSTVCTLTVARNYNCTGTEHTGTTTLSGGGLKPSGSSNDESWGSWTVPHADVCEVGGYMSSFNAGGRCGYCETGGVYSGYSMKLELRINDNSGTRRHWGDQTKSSGSCGKNSSFDMNANGGGWDPDSWGAPTFNLMIIDSGTNCGNSDENIFAESDAATLNYTYRQRQFFYDTRS